MNTTSTEASALSEPHHSTEQLQTKIRCVNHDCDQCKYKYDCDKAEQPTVKQSLTVEPVAWRSWNDHDGYGFWETKQEAEPWCAPDFFAEPLYTSPPASKPLTDEQIDAAVKAWFDNDIVTGRQPFAKRMRAAIEAANGIKGDA